MTPFEEMSSRNLNLKKISWLSSRILSGNIRRPIAVGEDTNIASNTLVGRCLTRGFASVKRVSRASSSSSPHADLISYVRASLDKLEGPSHHWLNRDTENKQLFKDKGTYVVLVGDLLNGTSDPSGFFEKLKLLQQWSPGVCFMGIHFSDQANGRTALAELIVKECLTFLYCFPRKSFQKLNLKRYFCCSLHICILFSQVICLLVDLIRVFATCFSQVGEEVRYLVFRDFKSPLIYQDKDLDIAYVAKALDSLSQDTEKSKSVKIFTNT